MKTPATAALIKQWFSLFYIKIIELLAIFPESPPFIFHFIQNYRTSFFRFNSWLSKQNILQTKRQIVHILDQISLRY